MQNVWGWTPIRSYQTVFLTYALLGLLNFTLAWGLSTSVELHEPRVETVRSVEFDEDDPLLSREEIEISQDGQEFEKKRSLFPKITKESRGIVFKLCCLFAIDSLASGLVPA